ncbi:MAG: glycosyltransferase family 4 protein, partial [Alphaproteobacteria bacterium]
VAARLFSGLADGLAARAWRPTGVPAMFKLLESLARDPAVSLTTVFAAKDGDERFSRAAAFRLAPIGRVHVLPYRRRAWLAALGLDGKWREASHALRCLALCLRYRPDVAYFTNANYVAAALFARLGLCRTVLRLLGLTAEHRRIATGAGGLERWLYRSPFDHVICTLEGSGGAHYLPRLLAPRVPRTILLNGVDLEPPDPAACARVESLLPRDGRRCVLFVGRLEPSKGCREFVEAALALARARPGAARAVLVGDGSLRPELESCAAGAGDSIHFAGAVPHPEVGAWLKRADIYVSLNRLGNLSNANLEAFAAGTCVVILGPDRERHIDEETEELVPPEAAVRLERHDVAASLTAALTDLVDHPERVRRHAEASTLFAARLTEGWDRRIAREIALIRGA